MFEYYKYYNYPLAFGLPATVPRFVTCGLCMWRQVLSSSVHLLKSFGHLRGHSRHLVATGVVVICAPFAIIWAPSGITPSTFWVPFWCPGVSFGHPWEPFGQLWGTLGPPGPPRQEKGKNNWFVGRLLGPLLEHFWHPFLNISVPKCIF